MQLVEHDDCTIVKYAWAAMGKPDVPASTSCCSMTGVICYGSTVTELYLSNKQLSGTIPSSLGSLTQLTRLWLGFNQLNGTIPSSFGNLVKLTGMDLGNNQLTGPVPSFLGNMAQLNELYMSNNQLSGLIPSSLGSCTQLTRLLLHNNKLTGVPLSLKLVASDIILLPNPMTLVPYDLFVKNPVSTLSITNMTNFLATPRLVKRGSSSTTATLTTQQLLDMCPLNKFQNQDISAGCLAGIVYFCQRKADLTQCHRYYEITFSNSIFKPIGDNCPAWKYGPNSANCKNALNGFYFRLSYTSSTGRDYLYNIVDQTFATFFAKTLFTNRDYAPCITSDQVKCTW